MIYRFKTMKNIMTHASLFTGIGGFDLAAQWMGWENVFQVEIDPFCQKVLAKNFPNTTRYEDIKKFEGQKYRGTIDILTGGFPCQPYSIAGKRKGNKDSRHLWPEMLRVIREVQPKWIVGENVGGLLSWDKGLVFEEVQTELETEGYEVQSFLLPACAVDAPHRRDRIWIVANAIRRNGNICEGKGIQSPDEARRETRPSDYTEWFITNNNNKGLQGSAIIGGIGGIRQNSGEQFAGLLCPDWQNFPTQSPICRRDDGVSNRVDRIKSLGNAIVPQVAFEIFKSIESVNNGYK
jgi:DNA (cytosine-5)-methyltransferase 1